MRIAILCNGHDVEYWQRLAIANIASGNEIFLLVAQGSLSERRPARHYFYYALNLAAIRNRMTRRVAFPEDDIKAAGRMDFAPLYDGRWASLPGEALAWLRDQRIDAIVKFGLGLLRVPAADILPAPILSFHHGDPRRYRGRPAGFYEMLHGEQFLGQIVQRLSNRLDGGEVLGFADSRVSAHSYKTTLIDAYRLSPLLLPKALAAVPGGSLPGFDDKGPAYRLPSNGTVVRFVWRMARRAAARLGYALFVEKRWRIGVTEVAAGSPSEAVDQAAAAQATWTVPAIPAGYSFLADPFFDASGAILAEALNSRSGKGELLRIKGQRSQRIGGAEGHVSYPFTFTEGDEELLLPEIEAWSRPVLFRIDNGVLVKARDLDIEQCRLLDPTLLVHDGHYYLFANRADEGPSVLRLWTAPALGARFAPHPASPIRISARGSRMAGAIAMWDGRLQRLGQDWRKGYGDGLMSFVIEQLTPTHYREAAPVEAAFEAVRGPHTLNRRGATLLFDFYEERRSPFAGLRRIAGRR